MLDSPLLAAAHLLQVLKHQALFEPVQAGELVTTGTLLSPPPIHAGETWTTELSGIELPALRLIWCDARLTIGGGDPMRAYVMTTGAVFGLITLAHVLRIFAEGRHVATDPWFLLLTVATAMLAFWAWRLLRLTPRP